MKYFYSRLIEMQSLIVELDKLDLSQDQRHHLATLVDSSLHHTILDAILAELNDQDKRAFIQILNEDDHAKIWKFLNEKVDKLEEKIKKASEDLKEQLHKDIRKAKKYG